MSRSPEETKASIVSSLFSRKDETGTLEENLISYIKIHEEERGQTKSRYLVMGVTKLGKVVIHKCKRNNNGSFSKGKTWQLDDMRVLEEIGPTDFALTMTVRRYHWMTDSAKDQTRFLTTVVKTFKAYLGGVPRLINFSVEGIPVTSPSASSQALHSAGLASAVSLSSSQGYDLAPPRNVHSERGSFSSMGDDAPASANSVYRQRVGSASSRGERPEVRPGTSASSRGYGEPVSASRTSHRQGSGDTEYSPTVGLGRLPLRQGSEDKSYNPRIGLGHPGQLRRGSDERGMASASPVPGQRFDNPPTSATRRPSAPASEIPPIVVPEEENDAYGGLTNEVLVSPRLNRNSVSSIPSVHSGVSPSHRSQPSPSKRSQPQLSASPSPISTQLPPVMTTTQPTPEADKNGFGLTVPSVNEMGRPREGGTSTPDQQRRVSFHPPPLTTGYSRDVLLTTRTGIFGSDVISSDDDAGDAIMANVEELIEDFDWTSTAAAGDKTRSGPDAIESRLLDELAALESANIHAFLESDDRVDQVLLHIDDALKELDDIDIQLTGYRMQLNAVTEDIQYIEGQNRGLQVQTSNQAALLEEIQQLLKITDVPKADLAKLTQVSPSTERGMHELEQAAASLYKALMAARDTVNEVAAATTHVQEYQDSNTKFCTRLLEYMGVTFQHQADQTLAEYRKSQSRCSLELIPHLTLGQALMQYEGLVLYVKDMEPDKYQKLCLNYITTMSELHQAEMKELLVALIQNLKGAPQVTSDGSFASAAATIPKSTGLPTLPNPVTRSKTTKRVGEIMQTRDKRTTDATRKVAEMYNRGVSEVAAQVVMEDNFINAFLHLADHESTFADYMELDTYFRRQAARHASQGLTPSMAQLARQVMELMFGFVDGELKKWTEVAIDNNPAAAVGIIAATERLAQQAEEEGTSMFLMQLFDKQLGRHRQAFDNFVNKQVQNIDAAKSTIKKRRGVFYFVRHFPAFVERVECQLDDAGGLPIRKRVDTAYERVVASVLASLQHSSKIVGAELASTDDKGQLYFHVVMIENLHIFVEEVSQLEVPALAVFVQRARGLYEENVKTYIRLMLRRGFARLMDFFDAVERQLKTTPASEVALHSSYSKSALKKVLKESGAKDMRKSIDAMARRVDKHFSDDDGSGTTTHHDAATTALIASVWREISDALRAEVQRATDIIAGSYGNSGLSLEYTARDVESICARAKRV